MTMHTNKIHLYFFGLIFLAISLGISPARADVYIDNGTPGTTSTGTWSDSSAPNSYGTTSVFARPDATYAWQFSGQPAGDYEVLMWWTVVSSRGSNIHVDVNASDGVYTATIDQTANGGQWNSLGTYSFDSSGSVTITAASDILPDGRTVSTGADAVWFRYASTNNPPTAEIIDIDPNPADSGVSVNFIGNSEDNDGTVLNYSWESDIDGLLSESESFATDSLSEGQHNITFRVQDNEGTWSQVAEAVLTVGNPPVDIVVDNGESGTSSTGAWSNSSGVNSYGTTSVYARPDATYTWQFANHPPGTYEIFMWWTVVSSRGSNIAVDVNTSDGVYTDTIDQTANGGQWNSIGTYYFDSNGSVTITASSDILPDGRTVSTSADAVRFVRQLASTNYTITATAGANGTISPSGSVTVNEGADQAFSITPDTGYRVADVLVDNISVGAVASYTFNGVVDNHTIDVSFEVTPTYTITATAGINGTISPSGSVIVNEGADKAFSITPDPGYQITDVLVDNVSIGAVASYTFNGVVDNHTIDASFETTPTFTITATAGINGTISPSGSVIVNEGADQAFIITPDPGCQITDVLVDSVSMGAMASYYTFNGLDDNHTIDASFEVTPTYTITATAGANGTISPSGGVTVNEGAGQTFNITPAPGYQIDDVLVDNVSVGAVASYTFNSVVANHTISASFEAVVIPIEIIIDNGGPGSSSTGTWSDSGGANSYGTTSEFARPSATYTWNFNGEPAGYYEVSMWWTTVSTRGSSISVDIATANEVVSTTIDQTVDGGQWNVLGEYYFDGTGNITIIASSVILSDGRTVSTCADAVKFRSVVDPGSQPPVANFSADPSGGVMPLTTEFTDLSSGQVDTWLWDFGDNETSTEPTPSHTYTVSGSYTVTLTVTNAFGSDSETKNSFIQVASSDEENIYIALGWGSNGSEWTGSEYDLIAIGGIEIEPDVWQYTNEDKGVTYYIRPIDTVEAFEAAIREEGSHVIYIGHSNYGLGLSFINTYQQDSIRFFDDPLISNVSTDMVDPSIPGLIYGQAYPNWSPDYSFGGSSIMPYDFDDPRGNPPYNYLATYTLPGDPIHYRTESADGSYIERFPDSGRPAWYSPDGSKPDPILNSEYFITNSAEGWQRCDFVGTWDSASPGDWHTAVYYMGQNYQYHAPGVGNNSATFTLPIANPGVYAVVATWYPDPANASNATYTIQHTDVGTGEFDTVVVDQRESAGFNTLGAYYFDAGSYTIQLTDNADGDVVADVVALMYLDDPQMVTKAEFSVDQNSGSDPMTVQFIDQSTVYINMNFDPAIQYQWDFGDGTSSQLANPMHTYSEPGIYTVSLTVTNEYGIPDTEIKENFIAIDRVLPLNAQFTADKNMGSAGDGAAINFLNQSTGNITEFLWDFGDGETSSEQNPTHSFTDAGTYTITLTITGPEGSDSETEIDFVYSTVGLVAADNTFDTKPHYYRNYSGTLLGSTIMDASPVAFPNEEMRYSRLFFNGCVSEHYYLPKFTRGVVFYTLTNRVATADPTNEYLINYLLGATDDEILRAINAVHYIHGYYDFNQLPPSMR